MLCVFYRIYLQDKENFKRNSPASVIADNTVFKRWRRIFTNNRLDLHKQTTEWASATQNIYLHSLMITNRNCDPVSASIQCLWSECMPYALKLHFRSLLNIEIWTVLNTKSTRNQILKPISLFIPYRDLHDVGNLRITLWSHFNFNCSLSFSILRSRDAACQPLLHRNCFSRHWQSVSGTGISTQTSV